MEVPSIFKVLYALKRDYRIKETKMMDILSHVCKFHGIECPNHKKYAPQWIHDNISTKELFFGKKLSIRKSKKVKTKKEKTSKVKQICTTSKRQGFYATDEWQLLRKLTLKKYGCKCMKCNKKNSEMHVDHIKPRSLFPELELDKDNLQVLCKDCNMEKSNNNCIDYRPDLTVFKPKVKTKLVHKKKNKAPLVKCGSSFGNDLPRRVKRILKEAL